MHMIPCSKPSNPTFPYLISAGEVGSFEALEWLG